MFEVEKTKIILASGSKIRAELLENTGLSFEIQPSTIDEKAIRAVFDNEDTDPADIAEVLAQAKAIDVSQGNADAIIIGCDQILALGSEIFEKPTTREQAQATLFRLRGKTHTLSSAIVIVKNGEVQWRHNEIASLTMRDFSAEFLGKYMALCGDNIYSSPGAYQLENIGIHLFDDIKGDYFSILGFPLLPLLQYLREQGCVKT